MRSYVLARDADGLRADLGGGAADLARIVPEVRDKLGALAEPPAGDPDELRWRLLQAVAGFFRNASQVQPLLIVLEDLHWADRGTLDLLTHLARNLDGARLLIIGTYRDVEVDRQHPLSGTLGELRRGASFGRVLLRGLGTPEVQQMLQAITGQPVPGSLAETIHRQTEGNPLFVQEVVRYLVEEGMLGQAGQTGVGSVTMSIPEGLRDVIGRRLSRLSPTCNRVLAVAAVIGRDFALATLQELAGLSEDDLVTALEEATRIGILEDRSRPGIILYRFAHAFFKQMLYEEMIAPRRLRLHQQVAQTLERQYGARLDEHAAELAEHFAQSTDLADLRKAVRYGELAAAQAMAVYAYGEAVRHLEQAQAVQEVLDPDPSTGSGQAALQRCDLLLALGEALIAAGEPLRAAEDIAERAYSVSRSSADMSRAGSACQLALGALRVYGAGSVNSSSVFRIWAERADQSAAPGTAARVYADLALASVRWGAGDFAAHAASTGLALQEARRLGEPEALFFAVRAILGNGQAPQRWAGRVHLAEEFCREAPAGVTTRTVAPILANGGMTLWGAGNVTAGQAAWELLAQLATRTQDPVALLLVRQVASLRSVMDGRLLDALDQATELMPLSVQLGAPMWGRQYTTQLRGWPLTLLGRAAEALKGFEEARSATGGQLTQALTPIEAQCLAHMGSTQQAAALLRGALESLNDESPAGPRSRWLEVALRLANREAASKLAAPFGVLGGIVPFLNSASACPARLLGEAAALLGEPDKARAYYQQGIEVCTKIGFRPELVLSRLELAELLLDHYPGERAAAIDHLDFAIRECRDMQMQPSLERALQRREALGS